MKSQLIMTPNSSVKSSLTVDSNPGFYFPGCRKDANCKCEICIASINATLDLMSTHRSSFAKSSSPPVFISRSPVSFNSLSAASQTPRSSARTTVVPVSPITGLTERTSHQEKEKKDSGYGIFLLRTFFCLVLLFGMEYGVSWMVSGVVRARLSPDTVKNVSLKSRDFRSMDGGFEFLKNELEGLVGGDVSSCSSVDHSLWKINQDGLLLSSRCVLYKSMAEEVSIWGWPLQTAGLIAAEFSTRSFTVIRGRVREFDPNTWILEYRRSFFVQNPKLVSAAVEFLRFRLKSQLKKMKQEFWLASAFGEQYSGNRRRSFVAPT